MGCVHGCGGCGPGALRRTCGSASSSKALCVRDAWMEIMRLRGWHRGGHREPGGAAVAQGGSWQGACALGGGTEPPPHRCRCVAALLASHKGPKPLMEAKGLPDLLLVYLRASTSL
jgi:hypothetical protein